MATTYEIFLRPAAVRPARSGRRERRTKRARAPTWRLAAQGRRLGPDGPAKARTSARSGSPCAAGRAGESQRPPSRVEARARCKAALSSAHHLRRQPLGRAADGWRRAEWHMHVALRRRLRLALPLTHRIEQAWVRVAREGFPQQWLANTSAPGVSAQDRRRLDLVLYDATRLGEAPTPRSLLRWLKLGLAKIGVECARREKLPTMRPIAWFTVIRYSGRARAQGCPARTDARASAAGAGRQRRPPREGKGRQLRRLRGAPAHIAAPHQGDAGA